MAGDPGSADTSGNPFAPINVNGLAQSAVQAFGIFEAGQTANKAASKLTGNTALYAILGVAGAVVLAILVLKH